MKTTRFVSVQFKLALVFTLIFLVGMLFLAGSFRISASVIDYNNQARSTYARVRELYQAKTYFEQLRKAITHYEFTSDASQLDEFYSNYSRVQQYLKNAASDKSILASEVKTLQDLATELETLRGQSEQIIAAVDEEGGTGSSDWDEVVEINVAVSARFDSIFTQINGLTQGREANLNMLRAKVESSSSTIQVATLVILLVFILLIIFAALTITRQVNLPLIQMAASLNELEHLRDNDFIASSLDRLVERQDEMGYLAREYLQMAGAVQKRQSVLQQEAEAIRIKIH